MEISLSIEVLSFLFVIAIVASFIDAVAGGGGLIALPALLLVGLSPVQSLATNKLQSSFGVMAASIALIRRKRTSLASMWPSMITAFIGSVIGTIAIQLSPAKTLEILIPVVMVIVGLYFLLAPKAGNVESQPRVSVKHMEAGVCSHHWIL